jgi:hypothetical protein
MSLATRYLRIWILATLTLLAAVAAFNLMVDPYDLFRVISWEGFNRIKSRAGQKAVLFKRENFRRMQPNALILGNSRAEIGFDPDCPAWPAALRPVFNLALPGSGPHSALEELQWAQDIKMPRLVLMGLDFLDFRVAPSPRIGIASPPVRSDDPLQRLRDRTMALVTINALVDSLGTLKAQRDPYSPALTDAGFNPARDLLGIARREGYDPMFRQRDQENAKSYVRGPKSIYRADGRPAPEFDAVGRIISAAHDRKATLILVIYPYHAHMLVLFQKAGLWAAFEAWKRDLVKLLETSPSGAEVELWDFSSFLTYANEKVPGPGDTKSELQWYWEAGHFKKSLGDIMLTRIFNNRESNEQWGRRLLPQNIEEHLRQMRLARDEYERLNPAEVADLAGLVDLAITR